MPARLTGWWHPIFTTRIVKRDVGVLFLFFALTVETSGQALEQHGPESFDCHDCNVVFISLTNLRADHLHAYGYFRQTSPNIDALAKRSLVFENAFSHASWTLPVAISLFTSQYPFTHGIMNRQHFEPLPSTVVTLTDILKANGYATAAFVGDRDYGLTYGHTSRFDTATDVVFDQGLKDWKRYGVLKNTVPKAISWMKENKERKFFLLVQGYDTHCPFEVPEKNDMFDPDYDGDIDFSKCYWTFRRTRPIKVKSDSGRSQNVYLLKTQPN